MLTINRLYNFYLKAYYLYLDLLNIKGSNCIYVVGRNIDHEKLTRNLEFHYLGQHKLIFIDNLSLIRSFQFYVLGTPILLFNFQYKQLQRIWLNQFNVDENACHVAAWSWHRALFFVNRRKIAGSLAQKNLDIIYDKFIDTVKSKLDKVFVFGTGPSLQHAVDFEFPEAVKIACNTMVKSDLLWEKIRPDIIVAGDAIHHFSNTDYANNFRADLKKRLSGDPLLRFFYPSDFHPFVIKEFESFKSQLIPMLPGYNRNPFHQFHGLPSKCPNENVLTMLQIPLASNLSKTIYFLGFDGRGKNDTGFWMSSDEYNYLDNMEQLRSVYPAFFYYYLEKEADQLAYVKRVHGQYLEKCMTQAEEKGFELMSLAKSNTPSFQKRYDKNIVSSLSSFDKA